MIDTQSVRFLESVNIFLTVLNHTLGRAIVGVFSGRDGEGVMAERF